MPRHVMTGCRAWEFAGSVHAGLVVGWAHKPAATIMERRVGKGGLVATTFRLLNDMQNGLNNLQNASNSLQNHDPVAVFLFRAMLETTAQMKSEN